MNEFKGYSLFNDIEDVDLRTRNQAVVMANMVEQNTRDKKITPKGASLILGYFSKVKKEDRPITHNKFEQRCKEIGYER